MKLTIQSVSIKKPCHETWDNMADSAGGKFCSSCQKNVVDFTGLSDKQIIGFIPSRDRICGRFNQFQLDNLNRHIAGQDNYSFSWKKLVAAATLIGIVPLFKAEARPNHTRMEQTNLPFKIKTQKIIPDSLRDFVLKGKVIAKEDSLPIPGATVKIKGTDIVTQTDTNGAFSLKVLNGDVLVIGFIGYERQEVPVTIDDKSKAELVVGIQLSLSSMGELVVTRASLPKRIWWKIKRIF